MKCEPLILSHVIAMHSHKVMNSENLRPLGLAFAFSYNLKHLLFNSPCLNSIFYWYHIWNHMSTKFNCYLFFLTIALFASVTAAIKATLTQTELSHSLLLIFFSPLRKRISALSMVSDLELTVFRYYS